MFWLGWHPDDRLGASSAAAFADRAVAWRPGLTRMGDTAGRLLLVDPRELATTKIGSATIRVVGQVHGRSARSSGAGADPGTPQGVARSLLTGWWGRYVAVIETTEGALALRDPSGAAPLLRASSEHLTVICSELTPELMASGRLDRSLDLTAIAHILARPPAAGHLSPLASVDIIAPGAAVSLDPREPPAQLWSPAAIASSPRVVSPSEILATVDASVQALARGRRVGVELSGGLDSSMVLASAAAGGCPVHAFNVATTAAGGNELRFAQAAARHVGVELIELGTQGKLPDYQPLASRAHGVRPFMHGLDSVFARARERLVARTAVDAVITGQGGDSTFLRLPTRLVAADRLHSEGLRALALAKLSDDATRAQASIWSVAATALGYRSPDDRAGTATLTPHLLGGAAHAALGRPVATHPWLREASRLPPAKHRHLMALVHSQLVNGARLFESSVPLLHPLMMQPLLELVVACPAHVLAQGPLDRGLVRAAMSDRLPSLVLRRRGKGEASDHYARAVHQNLEWLRQLLLDGMLASASLIDRDAVEAALRPDALRLDTDYRAFPVYASLEAWLRYWA
jgi:asparagine synthase (glutamine-hydrolysing)